MQPAAQDRDRPARAIVGGIDDELVIRRDVESFVNWDGRSRSFSSLEVV